MTDVTTTLIAIGGAINIDDPLVLKEFIRRAGGSSAQITIIPTASTQPDAGEIYSQTFQKLGVADSPRIIQVRNREETLNPAHIETLRQATGIFFTGGNQVRISVMFGGTPLETELLSAYHRGTIIAGTSAGASILSTVMVAYGRSGSTPRQHMAQFLPGLGFSRHLYFDQHFRQRDRLGRLLYIVANHPGLLGVGIDENTAAIVEENPDGSGQLSVVGKNAVTVVDGRGMRVTNVAEVTGSRPIALSGAVIHILTHGCTLNLATRTAHIPLTKPEA
jgi:cyanophycinase